MEEELEELSADRIEYQGSRTEPPKLMSHRRVGDTQPPKISFDIGGVNIPRKYDDVVEPNFFRLREQHNVFRIAYEMLAHPVLKYPYMVPDELNDSVDQFYRQFRRRDQHLDTTARVDIRAHIYQLLIDARLELHLVEGGTRRIGEMEVSLKNEIKWTFRDTMIIQALQDIGNDWLEQNAAS